MGVESRAEQAMREYVQNLTKGSTKLGCGRVSVDYFYEQATVLVCHSAALAIVFKISVFYAFEAARVIKLSQQAIYPLIDCILGKMISQGNYYPRFWDWVQGAKESPIAQVLWGGLIKRSPGIGMI